MDPMNTRAVAIQNRATSILTLAVAVRVFGVLEALVLLVLSIPGAMVAEALVRWLDRTL